MQLCYNNFKWGCDAFDQALRQIEYPHKCNRWPVQVFFDLMNMCLNNARILYNYYEGKNLSIRLFTEGVCNEYMKEVELLENKQ